MEGEAVAVPATWATVGTRVWRPVAPDLRDGRRGWWRRIFVTAGEDGGDSSKLVNIHNGIGIAGGASVQGMEMEEGGNLRRQVRYSGRSGS